MKLRLTLFLGLLALSQLSIAQEDANVIENNAPASNDEAPASNADAPASNSDAPASNADAPASNSDAPAEEVAPATPAPAPAGSQRQFVFSSTGDASGLSVSMTFTQQADNTVQMHCLVSTSLTATSTLERFCKPTADEDFPTIYLVKGNVCSNLAAVDSIEALKVAAIKKPNEDATETANFKYADLEGNCLTILQKKTSSGGGGGGRRFARQDDGGCSVLATANEEAPASNADAPASNADAPASDSNAPASNADAPASNSDAPAEGGRSGRLLMYPVPLTRTFNTINVGEFTILSLGTVFVAPTIVNSNVGGGVVSFGNFGSYTHDPMATLPYLQLPGWTVQSIYAIVGGLFLIYIIGLWGQNIPGVGEFFDTIAAVSRNSVTKKFNRVFTYAVDRTYDGLTTFVYNGINRFKRRNYKTRPAAYVRRNDNTDYDYYAAEEVQDYFRK